MTDCVFCPNNWVNLDVVKTVGLSVHEPPPFDYYKIAVVNPLNPVTEGHVLVIADKHSDNAAADQLVARELMYVAAGWVREHDLQANIIASIGPDATQTVMHTHVHIVPRTPNDHLPLPWTPQHELRSLEQTIRLRDHLRESSFNDNASVGLFQQQDPSWLSWSARHGYTRYQPTEE